MRATTLTNLIPSHGQPLSSMFSGSAPLPIAITSPFAQKAAPADDLYVRGAHFPNGGYGTSQTHLRFGAEFQQDDGEVKKSFTEHFGTVKEYFESARKAREERNWDNAKYWYNALLGALTATVDSKTARPSEFLTHLGAAGEELFIESVIGVAVFASPKSSKSTLDDLGRARLILHAMRGSAHGRKKKMIEADLASIKLLRAYTMMRYADAIDALEACADQDIAVGLEIMEAGMKGEDAAGLEIGVQLGVIGGGGIEIRHEFYENAEKKIAAALKLIDPKESKDQSALNYVGRLLLIDVLARQADCAHWRGDPDCEKRTIFDKLERAVEDIALGYDVLEADGEDNAAKYLADVAMLFKKMKADNRAIRVARLLTERDPILAKSRHAKALLASKAFADLLNEGGTGILPNYKLRLRPESKPVINRTKAALANAHSEGFLESVIVDGAGAMLSGAAAHMLGASPDVVLGSAAIGAGVARMGMSVVNGWMSEEARSVGQTGLYAGSGRGMMRDTGGLIGTGTLHAGLMLPTAAFSVLVPDLLVMAKNQVVYACNFYFDRMWQAETYNKPAATQGVNGFQEHFLNYFGRPFGIAAGLYYFAYLHAPKKIHDRMREFSNRWYIYPILLSGALCAAGDLSMTIAGKTDFFYRMGRGAIGIMAGSAMLMMGGIVALAHTGSWKELGSSIVDGWKSADKVNLVAIAIMTSVSSSVGGHMERVSNPSNSLLKFMHGALINATLLPLPIVMSGLLKHYINPIRSAVEGWQDAKGEGILRPYHAGKGFMLSFWAPYVKNRIGRAIVPWYDWPAAGIRRFIPGGWDTNWGTLAMSVYNIPTADSVGTMTWTETGRTDWEREAFKDLSEGKGLGTSVDATARFLYHWSTAGQKMSVRHWTYPHLPWDKAWQYSAIGRIKNLPKFPQYPDTQYFAGLLLQLVGKHKVELSDKHVEQVLDHVRCLASHPRNYAVMRPVVQALYAAKAGGKRLEREEEPDELASPHQLRLTRFFEDNTWIIDLLNIDRTDLTPRDAKHRSNLLMWSLTHIKLSREQYVKRVREHRALKERLGAEKKARKKALEKAKAKLGDWDEQKSEFMRKLAQKDHVELRRLEISLLGVKDKLYSTEAKDRQARRDELLRRLEGKGGGSADLSKELGELSEEQLWVQAMFQTRPKKAQRWRRRVIDKLAGTLLTSKFQRIRLEKEMEELGEVADTYKDVTSERPIYRLFEFPLTPSDRGLTP